MVGLHIYFGKHDNCTYD